MSGCVHLDNAEAIGYPTIAEHRSKFQVPIGMMGSKGPMGIESLEAYGLVMFSYRCSKWIQVDGSCFSGL